jgi:hypothetical protein
MLVKCKSLGVQCRYSTISAGSGKSTTVYDMASVRDHVWEMPWTRLATHPQVLWRMAVLMVLPAILSLIWAEGQPLKHPLIVLGVLFPASCLFYSVAYEAGRTTLLEEFARRERGLPAHAEIKVILERDWALFLSKLKTVDPLTSQFLDVKQQQERVTRMLSELELFYSKKAQENKSEPASGDEAFSRDDRIEGFRP